MTPRRPRVFGGLSRLLGIRAGALCISLQGVSLGETEAPRAPVVIERARRQAEQQLTLRLIENPNQIPKPSGERHERGWLDLSGRRLEHGPSLSEIPPGEVPHGLESEQLQVAGRKVEPSVQD